MARTKPQVEERSLEEFHQDPQNARRHTERNLAAITTSVTERGFGRPLVATADGTIMAGNATAEALSDLDMTDAIVITTDGTRPIIHRRSDIEAGSDAAILLGLYDNLAGDHADGYHPDVLAALLQQVTPSPVLMTRAEAADMMAGAAQEPQDPEQGLTDPDEVPEPPTTPVTRRGDVWLLGDHRLACGDATNREDVLLATAGEFPDLMLTDPPYGVGYVGGTDEHLTIANDEIDDPATRLLVSSAIRTAPIRPGAAFYIFSPAGNTETTFRLAIQDAGYQLRECLVWVKQQFVLGRQDYHWRHESILYGWREGAAHYFVADRTQDTVLDDDIALDQMSKAELLEYARELERAIPTTVLREDRPHRSAIHPTMKPVALVRRLMRNSSQPGQLVYDPFMGSGSTMIAAQQERRTSLGLEIEPRYCDAAVERWQAFTGQSATRVKAG